jgi:hypothetical protein
LELRRGGATIGHHVGERRKMTGGGEASSEKRESLADSLSLGSILVRERE